MLHDKFWNEVQTITYKDTRSIVFDFEYSCYRVSDYLADPHDSSKNYQLKELIYVVSTDDSNYGSLLYLSDGEINGSIAVVSGQRFCELIELMRAVVAKEVLLDELLTSNEHWKREAFKHIFNKGESYEVG